MLAKRGTLPPNAPPSSVPSPVLEDISQTETIQVNVLARKSTENLSESSITSYLSELQVEHGMDEIRTLVLRTNSNETERRLRVAPYALEW